MRTARVFEGMPHGGFKGAPEDAELAAEVCRFANECWNAKDTLGQ